MFYLKVLSIRFIILKLLIFPARRVVMREKTRRKLLSGILVVSLLVNSLLPYGVAGLVYAQELAVQESPTLLPSELPSASPLPSSTIISSPTATPDSTSSPFPDPTFDPSPTATPSASPEASPSATPSATPTTEPTLIPNADSSTISQEKIPPRREGNFLKEIKDKKDKDYIEGEVIVGFKKEKLDIERILGRAQAYVFEKKFALEKKDEIKSLNVRVFKSKKTTEEMIRELRSDPNVEYVEPNYIRPWSSTIPNDTDFFLQWALNNTVTPTADISAPEAWDIAMGNGSVVVGVLDSGVAYNHPDLINNMWDGALGCKDQNNLDISCPNHGWDFVAPDNNPIDDEGHGTHVAGIIGAEGNNSKGIAGVNWNVKLMALKVGDYRGAIVGDVVQAIDFAINNNVKILNASWGGVGADSQAEYDAINRFKSAGGIFVAAAGNGGPDWIGDDNDITPFYPSDYPLDNIISVTATDQNDDLASFSNYGVTSVDVGAPGVDVYSTEPFRVFNEDFEGVSVPDIGDKFTQGVNETWGTKSSIDDSNKAIFGDYANWGSYQDNVYSNLESQVINLSGKDESYLSFDLFCDTEPGLDGIILYFFDGLTWRYVDEYSGYVPYDYFRYLLKDYVNENFQLAFDWVTSPTGNDYQGCYLDEIKINDGSSSSEQYQYISGTSMATPHVTGLAGLIWSYQPGLNYSQVKDVILSTGDSLPSLSGKTVSGKRINAYNALLNSQSPVITDLSNDAIPTKSKIWNWDSNDPTDQFRHLIDQIENSTPSGEYGDIKTAIQPDGDGVYYLHVQARGATGIESSVTTVSVILDNSAPVINITNPLTGSAVNGLSTIMFTDTDMVNPQCSIGGFLWTPCLSGLTTLGEVPGFSLLLEGEFPLHVKDVDVAGNIGIDVELGIIKDTVAPTGEITSPPNDSTLTIVPIFTASASDSNGIASVKFQYKVSTSDSHIDMNTDLSVPFEASWSGISLVSNTTYDLKIIIEDVAGNTTSVSGISFTYDTTAPEQPIVINPSSPIFVNVDDYIVEGTAEAGSLVKIYIGPDVVGLQQLIDVETEFSISVALAQNAVSTFEVSSTDAVGNESIKTTVVAITEDSVVPAIADYTLDNPVISPQVSAGIKDTASFDLLFSEKVDYSILIKDENNDPVQSWTGAATNPYAKVWDGKDGLENYVADGIYTIEIVITDKADNSTTDTSRTITVDNDPLSMDSVGDKGINEEEELTFNVIASNNEGGVVNFSLSNSPLGASIDFSTGIFVWTPTETQGPGVYNFNINAISGDLFKSEEISITVNEVNSSPTASDGSVSINEDVGKVIFLVADDHDFPPNILTYSIVDHPIHGTVSLSDNEATYVPDIDYNGTDAFTFEVNDGAVNSNTASISITINPANDPPVAEDDNVSVDEDNVLTIAKSDLLSNDSDIDEDLLIFISVSNPVNGSVLIVSDNINFTPDDNFNGAASFEYTISDGILTDTATVFITISPVNDAPVAIHDSVLTEEDTSVEITLVGSDVDGDDLTYSIVDSPPNGILGAISSDRIIYTPNTDYLGSDSFTFRVNDGELDSNTATISITVSEVNDPPVLDPVGNKVVDELANLTFTVTATDPDSSVIYGLIDAPIGATINSNTGVFNFTPTELQGPGEYVLTITASDNFKTDSEQITITVNEVNGDPHALDGFISTNEDTAQMIILSATDFDLPANDLTYSIVDSPSHGTVYLFGKEATYAPSGDYNGPDSFTFKVNDESVDSNAATITITVNPVNDAPEAENDSVSVDEDTDLIVAKSILLVNDSDIDGDELNIVGTDNPVNGSVSIVGDDVKFIPNTDFNGAASFDYTISDGALTDTGTVFVTVNPINDPPTASNGFVSTNEDTAVTIVLSGNDIDGDGLEYSIVSSSSDGALGSISGSEVVYTPNTDYNGVDSFTFEVNDGVADSDIATVTVTVNPVNDAPEAGNDSGTTPEDIPLFIDTSTLLSNDTDIDGDTLLIISVENPTNGLVELLESIIVFTPSVNFNGAASFDYTISDGNGGIDVATVDINVVPVNDAPIAGADTIETEINTEVNIPITTLLSNDTDIDGDTLLITEVSNPTNGQVSISELDIIFVPDIDFTGIAGFDYVLSDGSLLDTGKVTIEVDVTAVISGEIWSRPGFGEITVSWTTDKPTNGRVVYDTRSHSIDPDHPNYGYVNSSGTVDDSPKTTSHTIALSGLLSSTTYYWRFVSSGSPTVISKEFKGDTFSIPGAPTPTGGEGGEVVGTSAEEGTAALTSIIYLGEDFDDDVLGDEDIVEEEEEVKTIEELLGLDSEDETPRAFSGRRIITGLVIVLTVYVFYRIFFRKRR